MRLTFLGATHEVTGSCYYRVGHVHNKDAVSTSVEYDSFEEMAGHLRYWSCLLYTSRCV